MRLGRWLALPFLALVLVAAYGFVRDDAAVEALAGEAACVGRGASCRARLARLEKTPLWRDLAFRVGRETVTVRCTRAAFVVGAHRCSVR